MAKPSIFFSHSSKDGAVLSALKDVVVKETGGAFEIFLSSDGQSIPFGRNWVYEIQEALQSTEAVFVFVSPQSIQSGWVYFEAGFSYSKQKRVIPIGIRGIDIALLSPPLGLLNGFNLDSADGGNKLIGTINEILDHDHRFRFSEADYASLFVIGEYSIAAQILEMIDEIYVTGRSENVKSDLTTNPFSGRQIGRVVPMLIKRAEEFGWPYASKYDISMNWTGMDLILHDSYEENFRFSIHGQALTSCLPILDDAIRNVLEVPFEALRFSAYISDHLTMERDTNLQSLLLRDTEIQLSPGGGFKFRDILFELVPDSTDIDPGTYRIHGAKPEIRFRSVAPDFDLDELRDLIQILIETRLLMPKG